MEYSLNGLELTKRFEQCRLTAYPDSKGVPTIGWGHTVGVKLGDTCTRQQADEWLLEDVQWAVSEVNRLVTSKLTQNEFDALVDFTFNCGSGNLQHSTLLQLVNRGDFDGAVKEFEKWRYAGGKELAGLLKRRQAEAAVFVAPDIDGEISV